MTNKDVLKDTIDTIDDFYGVYYGQLALPVNPDKITYMDNDLFDDCVIINHETQKEIPVYDMALATGRDPYEMFLNGSISLITIENPNATTDKELIIFSGVRHREGFVASVLQGREGIVKEALKVIEDNKVRFKKEIVAFKKNKKEEDYESNRSCKKNR